MKEIFNWKKSFEYYSEELPQGHFRIAPSGISKFFECSAAWYTDSVAKLGTFAGNTSTHLGTIVHACAEAHSLGFEIDHVAISFHISRLEEEFKGIKDDHGNPLLNAHMIRQSYGEMATEVCKWIDSQGKPVRVEEYIHTYLKDSPDDESNIMVGGSVDAVFERGSDLILTDWKTATSARDKSDERKHRLQLLTYAYVYKKLGVDITHIRFVTITVPKRNRVSEKTGKPLKDYPCEIHVHEEKITKFDMDWIEEQLNIIKLTYILGQSEPQFLPILYRDNIKSYYSYFKIEPQAKPNFAEGFN